MNSFQQCLIASFVLVLQSGPSPGQPQQFPVILRDAMGREVTIPRRPARIITLAPSVTEILFAIGLDKEVVGISSADDFPPDKVKGRPRIGGVQLNVEAIIALRPDLVIGLPSLQRPQLDHLIRLGLTVLTVDANTLEQTYDQILLLGRATGKQHEATLLAAQMRVKAAGIARRVAQAGVRPAVYIEIWNEPLNTAAGGTFIDAYCVSQEG